MAPRRGHGGRPALTVGILILALPRSPEDSGSPPVLAAAEPEGSRLLIYELESGTKLYFALRSQHEESAAESVN